MKVNIPWILPFTDPAIEHSDLLSQSSASSGNSTGSGIGAKRPSTATITPHSKKCDLGNKLDDGIKKKRVTGETSTRYVILYTLVCTYTHAHAHIHTRNMHAHTHTHAHTHAHTQPNTLK